MLPLKHTDRCLFCLKMQIHFVSGRPTQQLYCSSATPAIGCLSCCSSHERIIYRASGVKLILCGHGKGSRDLSAEHSMRITVGYGDQARGQVRKLLRSTGNRSHLWVTFQYWGASFNKCKAALVGFQGGVYHDDQFQFAALRRSWRLMLLPVNEPDWFWHLSLAISFWNEILMSNACKSFTLYSSNMFDEIG